MLSFLCEHYSRLEIFSSQPYPCLIRLQTVLVLANPPVACGALPPLLRGAKHGADYKKLILKFIKFVFPEHIR